MEGYSVIFKPDLDISDDDRDSFGKQETSVLKEKPSHDVLWAGMQRVAQLSPRPEFILGGRDIEHAPVAMALATVRNESGEAQSVAPSSTDRRCPWV